MLYLVLSGKEQPEQVAHLSTAEVDASVTSQQSLIAMPALSLSCKQGHSTLETDEEIKNWMRANAGLAN